MFNSCKLTNLSLVLRICRHQRKFCDFWPKNTKYSSRNNNLAENK